jgi:hypothetical protein
LRVLSVICGQIPLSICFSAPPRQSPSAMPKRRHILILLACGLAAGLDALLSAPREPAYQGRFLTEWLENHRGDLTNSPSDRT